MRGDAHRKVASALSEDALAPHVVDAHVDILRAVGAVERKRRVDDRDRLAPIDQQECHVAIDERAAPHLTQSRWHVHGARISVVAAFSIRSKTVALQRKGILVDGDRMAVGDDVEDPARPLTRGKVDGEN